MGYPHRVRVRFADTDKMGVAYHARYFESRHRRARVSFLAPWGGSSLVRSSKNGNDAYHGGCRIVCWRRRELPCL